MQLFEKFYIRVLLQLSKKVIIVLFLLEFRELTNRVIMRGVL